VGVEPTTSASALFEGSSIAYLKRQQLSKQLFKSHPLPLKLEIEK
jgi:hypothetical protein